MNVTDKLVEEHRLILSYISVLKEYLKRISEEDSSNHLVLKLECFVDFIKNYADKYHHAKEENILFKYLERPGVLTHCNPLPVMMGDHEDGRYFINALLVAIKDGDKGAVIQNADGWLNVLEAHIDKEDNVLYVMAENGLNRTQKHAILKEYEGVEREMDGEKLEIKYKALLDVLKTYLNEG